jgi:hypothetical protein
MTLFISDYEGERIVIHNPNIHKIEKKLKFIDDGILFSLYIFSTNFGILIIGYYPRLLTKTTFMSFIVN